MLPLASIRVPRFGRSWPSGGAKKPAHALAAETLKLERVMNAECGMRNAE